MDRRIFVRSMALLLPAAKLSPSALLSPPSPAQSSEPTPQGNITAARIPRWRGFNLQGNFAGPERPYNGPAYEEFDFATRVEWGFVFARLPLSYWAWGSRDDWTLIREEPLKQIDRAIDLGKRYGVHINLNFHRTPGYCINQRELEPADLFTGTKIERDRALAASV